jgi:ribosomal protein L7Ae-like RNA K-turn-binding protein
MLRFVRAPDGALTPDLAAKLPGDAVWVMCQADMVAALVAGEAPPDEMPDLVAKLLRARLRSALGLAKKAGAIITGFAKIDTALMRGELTLLLAAADGAADGRKKLAYKAGQGNVAIVDILTSEELGMALGRANVIHAGATEAGWATQILKEATRLTAFYSGPDGLDRSDNA